MGLGTFLSNKLFGDPAAEAERRKQALEISNKLIEYGAPTDVVNSTVNDFLKTGQLNIPTQHETGKFALKQPEGPPTAGGALPGMVSTPETEPVKLQKKSRALFAIDKATGQYSQIPTDGYSDVSTVEYGSPEAKKTSTNGENIYVNAATGEEVRREPNGMARSQVIKVGTPSGGAGSEKETPAQKLARSFLDKYNLAPDDVKMAHADEAQSAMETLGTGYATKTVEPGFFRKLVGGEAKSFPVTTFGKKAKPTKESVKTLQAKAQAQSQAPAQTSTETDRVDVVSPDGKIGHIPKEQLDAALKQGFQLVKK